MKAIKRIPVTLKHLPLVFHYGRINGIKYLISQIYEGICKEEALREVYEKMIKPTADIARIILNEENALSFDPNKMEFVIFDKKADEVNFDNRNDIEPETPKDGEDI